MTSPVTMALDALKSELRESAITMANLPPEFGVACLTEAGAQRIAKALTDAAAALEAMEAQPTKSLNAMAADLLRPYLQPGQKVIWRGAFRWYDDEGVLSNHYDGMEIERLADDFGYDWDYDMNLKHAAIVTPLPTPPKD